MANHLSLLLCFIIGAMFLEFYVEAYISLSEKRDFPMGMGYDEEFNIKRLKPKKPMRKTIGSYRLPKTVVPLHYQLELRPILEGGSETELNTAPGKVTIKILVKESANSITVHAKSIWIDNHAVSIKSPVGVEKLNVTGHNTDEERSFYTVFLDGDLVINQEYCLTIPFRSKIPSAKKLMAGLYRTTFVGSDGAIKTGAVTQFQKDDASRAFPCFDEPQLKAEFSIKIGRLKEKYKSFSNMQRVGEPEPITGLDDWVWDTYERTLKFPIYVIAFAVMPDYVAEDTPKDFYRIPIKTWVPKAERSNTSVKYAAEASGKILTYFDDLFRIPFMLNKMDNLAVADIELLAMEHPGLVTYRTNLLSWHLGADTQWELFNGIQLIAHEFSHQWFGNLVTCSWWNDFWLNEAFARYYQFVGTDQSGIDFRATDRFVIDVTQWAMEFDEGPDTVSIRNDDTDKVFYQPFHIEYEKGASLVRMMQTILTQETFINGLRKYFKRHAYGNVNQDDLFNALTEQGREDGTLPNKYTMAEVMKPWLTKTGFPCLFVSRGDSNSLYLSQQRFIVHPIANDKIEPGLWFVPIWFITKNGPRRNMDKTPPNIWMEKDTLTTYMLLVNPDDWIIVNPEARGYYRVIYDRTLTNLIIKQLEEDHTVFHFATRSQLFDDHFRSSQARYISVNHALSLTSYLAKEDDLIVWVTVFNNFRKIFLKLIDTPIVDTFKKFVLQLIVPPMRRLGTHLNSTATPSDIMLHTVFMDWLCTMEDPLCEEIVRGYMDTWMAKPDVNPVPVDLISVVTCAAVAHISDKNSYQFFLEQYKSSKNPRQRSVIARALTCSKNESDLKTLIEHAINADHLDINTTEHGLLVLTNIVRNPNGRKVIWETIKAKSRKISQVLGPMAIPKIIATAVPYLSNQGISKLNYEIVDFIRAYLKTMEALSDRKAYESLLKSAQVVVDNSLWMDYFYDDTAAWLKSKVHD